MKANERRKAIVNLLLTEKKPIPGGVISEKFSVSRQIIVQDISVLKVEMKECLYYLNKVCEE